MMITSEDILAGALLMGALAVFICVTISFAIWVDGGLNMKLSNKAYDIIKYIAQYVLPALGTLYFALAQIWSLPYGEQIVGTITSIDAFLAAILGISSYTYNHDSEDK